MAKFAIWAALAAFGVVAAVTLVSIHPQKVEAECKATELLVDDSCGSPLAMSTARLSVGLRRERNKSPGHRPGLPSSHERLVYLRER